LATLGVLVDEPDEEDEEDDEDEEDEDSAGTGTVGGFSVGAKTFRNVKVDSNGFCGGFVGGNTTAAEDDDGTEPAGRFAGGRFTVDDPGFRKVNHTTAPIAHATTKRTTPAITALPAPEAKNDVAFADAEESGAGSKLLGMSATITPCYGAGVGETVDVCGEEGIMYTSTLMTVSSA
jgi:hypothetical protein